MGVVPIQNYSKSARLRQLFEHLWFSPPTTADRAYVIGPAAIKMEIVRGAGGTAGTISLPLNIAGNPFCKVATHGHPVVYA